MSAIGNIPDRLFKRTGIFRSATSLYREAIQQLWCDADERVRQRLQILHGRQHRNLHDVMQFEGCAINGTGRLTKRRSTEIDATRYAATRLILVIRSMRLSAS